MSELKTKYKALIFLITLMTVTPMFLIFINEERRASFLETTYIVQAAADHYNIEMDECITCQENGWLFIGVVIVFLALVIFTSYIAVLIPLAMILRLFADWPFSFTIKTFLLGKYPEQWKATNTLKM